MVGTYDTLQTVVTTVDRSGLVAHARDAFAISPCSEMKGICSRKLPCPWWRNHQRMRPNSTMCRTLLMLSLCLGYTCLELLPSPIGSHVHARTLSQMVFDRQPQCELKGYRLVTRRLPDGQVFLIRDAMLNNHDGKVNLPTDNQAALQRLRIACDQEPQCAMVTSDGALLGMYADFSVKKAAEIVEWSVPMYYCPSICCGTYISDSALDALKAQARSSPVEKQSWTKPQKGEGPASEYIHDFSPNDKNRTRLQQCKLLQSAPRAYPSCPEVCRVACCIPEMRGYISTISDIEWIFMLDYDQCHLKCDLESSTGAACGFLVGGQGSKFAYAPLSTYRQLRFFYKTKTKGPRVYKHDEKKGDSKPAARGTTAQPPKKCTGPLC